MIESYTLAEGYKFGWMQKGEQFWDVDLALVLGLHACGMILLI